MLQENKYYFPKRSTKKYLKKLVKAKYTKIKDTTKIKSEQYKLFLKRNKKIKNFKIVQYNENKSKLNIRFLTKDNKDVEITITDITLDELYVLKASHKTFICESLTYTNIYNIFTKKKINKDINKVKFIADNIPHKEDHLLTYTESTPKQVIYFLNAYLGEHFLLSSEGKLIRDITNKLIATDLNTFCSSGVWKFKDNSHENFHIGAGLPNYDFEIQLNSKVTTSVEFKNLYSIDYSQALAKNVRKTHGAKYILCYLYPNGTRMQLFKVINGTYSCVDLLETFNCPNLREQLYLTPELFPDTWKDLRR